MANVANIRFMLRRDFPQVLEAEREIWEHPWTGEKFNECLRQDCTGIVAERQERIVGYAVYGITGRSASVLNLSVRHAHRRQGIGAALLNAVHGSNPQRDVIVMVREHCVGAQLFLRARGYLCIATDTEFYEEPEEDAYIFRLEAVRDAECQDQPVRRGRR